MFIISSYNKNRLISRSEGILQSEEKGQVNNHFYNKHYYLY